MKKFTVTYLFILATLSSMAANCGVTNSSFKSGEVLSYTIYYKLGGIWINAGSATFSVQQTSYGGHTAFHYIGSGQTSSRMDYIYKVRDRYESYANAYNLLPYHFKRSISEGSTRLSENVKFNRSTNKAVSGNSSFSTTACTHDVLSAVYLCRNINYNAMKYGEKKYIDLFLDKKLHKTYVQYLGKEYINTSNGKLRTIKVSPKLIEGMVFDTKNKMYIWVTDDANKVPVKIQSSILVGSVIVKLSNFRNLKNKSILK